MKIPLVVILYSGVQFHAPRRMIIEGESSNFPIRSMAQDLRETSFDKKTFSIGIHPGPDFVSETVIFSEQLNPRPNPNFPFPLPNGRALVLPPGIYRDLSSLNFEGLISSVIFSHNPELRPGRYVDGVLDLALPGDEGIADASKFTSIPLVVQLFNDKPSINPLEGEFTEGQESKSILVVESSRNLRNEFGGDFDDVASNVVVWEGTGYKGEIARLYEDPQTAGFDPKDQLGGSLDIMPQKGNAFDRTISLRERRFEDRVSAVFLGRPSLPVIKKLRVTAQVPFVRTGIALEKDEKFSITASGQWSNGGDSPIFVGPDGFVGFQLQGTFMESANLGMLIGKVNDNVFPIGLERFFQSPSVGELLLGMNDVPNTFNDNMGELEIEVTTNL